MNSKTQIQLVINTQTRWQGLFVWRKIMDPKLHLNDWSEYECEYNQACYPMTINNRLLSYYKGLTTDIFKNLV